MMTVGKYLATFLSLLALTGLTFGLSFVSLGAFQWPVALGIAAIKAILIALYFMHLSEMSAAHALAFVVALVLLAVLIFFVISDVETHGVLAQTSVHLGSSGDSELGS